MAPVDKIITNQRTLLEWVKNFRVKKLQMKRKTRGDLRVCAILTTALNTAEQELRRKQQERFSKWLELQAKLGKPSNKCSNYCFNDDSDSEADLKRRQDINDLWNGELKGLDEFMRSISRGKS